jgi:hypothetical protein
MRFCNFVTIRVLWWKVWRWESSGNEIFRLWRGLYMQHNGCKLEWWVMTEDQIWSLADWRTDPKVNLTRGALNDWTTSIRSYTTKTVATSYTYIVLPRCVVYRLSYTRYATWRSYVVSFIYDVVYDRSYNVYEYSSQPLNLSRQNLINCQCEPICESTGSALTVLRS